MSTIIQITDTHLFKDDDDEIFSVKSNKKFYEVINKIKSNLPDYFFLTGDISQDETPESYQKIVNIIDALGINTYWIPGNHDDISIMENVFSQSKYMKKADHLLLPYWHYIFLNTKLDGTASGELAETELTKLHRLLNKSNSPNIALIMHHHPIEVQTPLIDQYILKNQNEFWEIVDKYKNIKLIICGHVHGDYTIQRNEITMECAPATCLQWERGTKNLKIENTIGYKKYQFSNDSYQAETIIWR